MTFRRRHGVRKQSANDVLLSELEEKSALMGEVKKHGQLRSPLKKAVTLDAPNFRKGESPPLATN